MFVNENPKTVADLLEKGIVDIAQLHGDEDEEYIKALRKLTDRPYILAGGLDPLNVKGAVEKLHPYGVDVSSGIETAGVKDIDKMREFVFRVRG